MTQSMHGDSGNSSATKCAKAALYLRTCYQDNRNWVEQQSCACQTKYWQK